MVFLKKSKNRPNEPGNFVHSRSGLRKAIIWSPRLFYKNRVSATLVQNRVFIIQCPPGPKKIFSFAKGNTLDFFCIWAFFFFRKKLGEMNLGPFFFLCNPRADRFIFGCFQIKKTRFFTFFFKKSLKKHVFFVFSETGLSRGRILSFWWLRPETSISEKALPGPKTAFFLASFVPKCSTPGNFVQNRRSSGPNFLSK